MQRSFALAQRFLHFEKQQLGKIFRFPEIIIEKAAHNTELQLYILHLKNNNVLVVKKNRS